MILIIEISKQGSFESTDNKSCHFRDQEDDW
jgi:hypothetical protein